LFAPVARGEIAVLNLKTEDKTCDKKFIDMLVKE
jgi:hypothetical protein